MREGAGLAGAEITVPASVGNLGAGFDTIGVALALYLRVRVCEVDAGRPNEFACRFVDRELVGDNYIERAFRLMADRAGIAWPCLALEVRSEIPMQAGLGSSAAAVVAGLRLFERLAGPRSIDELLAAACRIEGHPDNAAAALLGGLTASCQLADGAVTALAASWPASIRFVVATPAVPLRTAEARRVLPRRVSLEDAVFNLQRVALLLQSVHLGDRHYLREALRDRWHQPFRSRLVPGLDRALALEHPDLLGVCLSGAGPSIVALAERNFPAIEALLRQCCVAAGADCGVRTVSVHQKGSS